MNSYYPQHAAAFGEILRRVAGQRVAVIGHARPDGDCIGSQVALARALASRGVDVVCINGDPVPRRLQYLVTGMNFLRTDAEIASHLDRVAIYVDCADQARVGERLKAKFPKVLACIDHHLSNVGFAEYNLLDAGSAATCEMLAGLLLDDAGDRFLAAGSPWFLTLFGRDSLWAARMLAPLDPGLVLSTLRVLARRQGSVDDPSTEEQPGKILHEVREQVLDLGEQRLPPLYYGTVDATPLFVCALADAAAWGADRDEVRALLPAARACLEWVLEQSAATGWLAYVDHTGEGLSNQGWKDSHDGIQFADGRLAQAPISLKIGRAHV